MHNTHSSIANDYTHLALDFKATLCFEGVTVRKQLMGDLADLNAAYAGDAALAHVISFLIREGLLESLL